MEVSNRGFDTVLRSISVDVKGEMRLCSELDIIIGNLIGNVQGAYLLELLNSLDFFIKLSLAHALAQNLVEILKR